MRNKNNTRLNRDPKPLPPMRPAHVQTRKEHAQETAQDYVELIARLIDQNGEARAIEIARCLGVSHVTVGKTLKRLQKQNLVSTKPYSPILLTKSGEKLATLSRKKHEIVVKFLLALGVPDGIAESDSEGIEHHVSQETLKAFSRYLANKS
jgi:DtxR family transcriptional regulator, manganese transport regulator